MWSKVILFLTAVAIGVSAYTTKSTCALSDNECQRVLFEKALHDLAPTGIPEAGLAPFDPYDAKDIDLSFLGMINIRFTGVATGIKTCNIKTYALDTTNLMAKIGVLCETLDIEGDYEAKTLPTLTALIGDIKISGKGKGFLKIEKLKLDLEFPFGYKKLDDGEIYFVMDTTGVKIDFEILGKVTFGADNIKIGSVDISSVASAVINENWSSLANLVGRNIVEPASKIFVDTTNKVFLAIPIKNFISDDLTPYLKN